MATGREYNEFTSMEGHQLKDGVENKGDTSNFELVKNRPLFGNKKKDRFDPKQFEDAFPANDFGPPSSDVAVNRRCPEGRSNSKSFVQQEFRNLCRLSEKQAKGLIGDYCYLDDDDECIQPPTLTQGVEKTSATPDVTTDTDTDAQVDTGFMQCGEEAFQSIEQMWDSILQSVPESTSNTSANDMEHLMSYVWDTNSHHLGVDDVGDSKNDNDSQLASHHVSTDQFTKMSYTTGKVFKSHNDYDPLENDTSHSLNNDNRDVDQISSSTESSAQKDETKRKSHLYDNAPKSTSPYVILQEEMSTLNDSTERVSLDASELSAETSGRSRSLNRRKRAGFSWAMSAPLDRARMAARGFIKRARSLSPRNTKSKVNEMLNKGKSCLRRSKDACFNLTCLSSQEDPFDVLSRKMDLMTTPTVTSSLQNSMECCENCRFESDVGERIKEIEPRLTMICPWCKQNRWVPGLRPSVSTLVDLFEAIDRVGLCRLQNRKSETKPLSQDSTSIDNSASFPVAGCKGKGSILGDSSEDVTSHLTFSGSSTCLEIKDIKGDHKDQSEIAKTCVEDAIQNCDNRKSHEGVHLMKKLLEEKRRKFFETFLDGMVDQKCSAEQEQKQRKRDKMTPDKCMPVAIERNNLENIQNAIHDQQVREHEIYEMAEMKMISELDNDCVSLTLSVSTDGQDGGKTVDEAELSGQRTPPAMGSVSDGKEHLEVAQFAPPPNSPNSGLRQKEKKVGTTVSLFETTSVLSQSATQDAGPEASPSGELHPICEDGIQKDESFQQGPSSDVELNVHERFNEKTSSDHSVLSELQEYPCIMNDAKNDERMSSEKENIDILNLDVNADIKINAFTLDIIRDYANFKSMTSEEATSVDEIANDNHETQKPVAEKNDELISIPASEIEEAEFSLASHQDGGNVGGSKDTDTISIENSAVAGNQDSKETAAQGSINVNDQNDEWISDISGAKCSNGKGLRKASVFKAFSKIPEEPEINDNCDDLPSPPSNSPCSSGHGVAPPTNSPCWSGHTVAPPTNSPCSSGHSVAPPSNSPCWSGHSVAPPTNSPCGSGHSVHAPLRRYEFYEDLARPSNSGRAKSRIGGTVGQGIEEGARASRNVSENDSESVCASTCLYEEVSCSLLNGDPCQQRGGHATTSNGRGYPSALNVPKQKIEQLKADKKDVSAVAKLCCDSSLVVVSGEKEHQMEPCIPIEVDTVTTQSILSPTTRDEPPSHQLLEESECLPKTFNLGGTVANATEMIKYLGMSDQLSPITNVDQTLCPDEQYEEKGVTGPMTNESHDQRTNQAASSGQSAPTSVIVNEPTSVPPTPPASGLLVTDREKEKSPQAETETSYNRSPRSIRWDLRLTAAAATSLPESSNTSSDEEDKSMNNCSISSESSETLVPHFPELEEKLKHSQHPEILNKKALKIDAVNDRDDSSSQTYPGKSLYQGQEQGHDSNVTPNDVTQTAGAKVDATLDTSVQKSVKRSTLACGMLSTIENNTVYSPADSMKLNKMAYQAGLMGLRATGQLNDKPEDLKTSDTRSNPHLPRHFFYDPTNTRSAAISMQGGISCIDTSQTPLRREKTIFPGKKRTLEEFSSPEHNRRVIFQASTHSCPRAEVVASHSMDGLPLTKHSNGLMIENQQRKESMHLVDSEHHRKDGTVETLGLDELLCHKMEACSKKITQTLDFVERAQKRIDQCNALIEKSTATLRRSSEVSQKCQLHLRTANLILCQRPWQRSYSNLK